MSQAQELLSRASNPAFIINHTFPEGKLEIIRFPFRAPISTGEAEERRRLRAEAAFIARGLLKHLEEIRDKTSPDRNLALDFGFEGFTPVAGIRWAPQLSPENEELVISKAVKIVPKFVGMHPAVYYVGSYTIDGRAKTYWGKFSPQKEGMSKSSVVSVIQAAMYQTNIKIADRRKLCGEKFTGNPGIGKVEIS